MELELGLALPNSHFVPIKSSHLNVDKFDDNFSEISDYDSNKVEHKTLPLLIWNDQPNEEEDDGHQKRRTFEACYQELKEENGVLGWPPIKSWRKKLIHGINDEVGWNKNNTNINHRHNIGIRNSMYVKVKMEGVAIGRKIDLRLYNSYQILTNTLLQMFPKYESCDGNDGFFTLLYQDKEGDWMLAGDVPWETFMETAQRIQILRNWKSGRSTRKSSHIS
ncbi:auxin-responsive protein IAA29-like isoform X2 [Solanum dulcamara]|uniref:auxin-responsive protein IAA29-like isoform X2 n=1 Tax=Solanum dulcamara TaxID=45834 RepID=UPI002486C672|nr:auxin-responsive protein IAA29-like isoform X2 [Solanum dulcamara]